jgi:hypothetical protein
VDSARWERRRGGKPQGRQDTQIGSFVADGPRNVSRMASEVLEGERKAKSGITTGRETDR